MNNFTKGPWTSCISEMFGLSYIMRGEDQPVDAHKKIAEINRRLPKAEANAHLVAAAPDMYEALQEVIDSGLLHGLTNGHEKMNNVVHEVLDKARGEFNG